MFWNNLLRYADVTYINDGCFLSIKIRGSGVWQFDKYGIHMPNGVKVVPNDIAIAYAKDWEASNG